MKIPSMMDIHNDTLRRGVLIVFLVPAVVIAILVHMAEAFVDGVRMAEAFVEVVQELPDSIRTVWQRQTKQGSRATR